MACVVTVLVISLYVTGPDGGPPRGVERAYGFRCSWRRRSGVHSAIVFLYLCQNPRVPFCYSVFVPIQNTTGVPEPLVPILLVCQNPRVPFCYSVFVPIQNTTGVPEPPLPILLRSIFPRSMIQNMCVFKPVLQCVGSNIVHVLPVKSGGRGSFCQPVHCACVKMTSRVGKHETS